MVSTAAVRTVLVALIVVGSMAAFTSTATYGQFSDAHGGTASFTAASKFNHDDGPSSSNKVYNDVNDNGQYDENVDETIKVKGLDSYENEQANVVLSPNVGELDPDGGVSITANSVSSEVNVSSSAGDVTLNASRIALSDTSVSVENGNVTIRSSGDVDLEGTTVEATNGAIAVEGQSVSMKRSRLSADAVSVAADRNGGGTVEATAAEVTSDAGDVGFEASGDVVLDAGDLTARDGRIVATFPDEDSTLYVDSTVVNDGNGTLYYSPPGVTVVPAERTENGDVRPESN